MNAIELYARETPGHAEREAHSRAVLERAAAEHPGSVVLATSLGAEDQVLADMIGRSGLPIAVATLDTGALHLQTLHLAARTERHCGIEIERYLPRAEQVIHFLREHGDQAMYRSLALRKACCAVRKLEPLQRLLASRSAWITGLRRDQSDGRSELPFTELGTDGRIKFNPLADWSQADVWWYIQRHGVPYNPLHDEGYPSIGCAPCTRAITVGEPFRAGRWWWEQETAKECGLHVARSAAATPTAARQPPHPTAGARP